MTLGGPKPCVRLFKRLQRAKNGAAALWPAPLPSTSSWEQGSLPDWNGIPEGKNFGAALPSMPVDLPGHLEASSSAPLISIRPSGAALLWPSRVRASKQQRRRDLLQNLRGAGWGVVVPCRTIGRSQVPLSLLCCSRAFSSCPRRRVMCGRSRLLGHCASGRLPLSRWPSGSPGSR